MKERYIEDYSGELHKLFPEIPEEELKRMMLDISSRLTSYMKIGTKGFMTRVNGVNKGKKTAYKFQVDRVYNRTNLIHKRTKAKIMKAAKDKKNGRSTR